MSLLANHNISPGQLITTLVKFNKETLIETVRVPLIISEGLPGLVA